MGEVEILPESLEWIEFQQLAVPQFIKFYKEVLFIKKIIGMSNAPIILYSSKKSNIKIALKVVVFDIADTNPQKLTELKAVYRLQSTLSECSDYFIKSYTITKTQVVLTASDGSEIYDTIDSFVNDQKRKN